MGGRSRRTFGYRPLQPRDPCAAFYAHPLTTVKSVEKAVERPVRIPHAPFTASGDTKVAWLRGQAHQTCREGTYGAYPSATSSSWPGVEVPGAAEQAVYSPHFRE